jgi:hypothetical protein
MSWLDGKNDVAQATGLAIAEAARLTLPIATRSCTRNEVLGRHHDPAQLALIFYAIIPLIVVPALAIGSPSPPRTLVIGEMLALIGFWLVFLLSRGIGRKGARYRDPGIRIEVREDGIRVVAPVGEELLSWDEAVIEVLPVNYRNIIHFGGIRLDTRFGPQRVDGIWYHEGRKAAAAIVRRASEAHTARERAKLGRIG